MLRVMPPTDANPYDEVLYPGHAYNYTHPDRLSVVGALFGMTPAPVEGCRVLELGCGDGANLLPMAATLPGSTFFGLDLAARPVAQGNADAAELGLSNLRLEAMDILDFPADAGTFDYIIAHGIYSWVPDFVREKMLAICAAHLAPQGIVYLSYKTYPGSYTSETIHQMMRYQASRRPGLSEEQVVHAGLDMVRTVVDCRQGLDAYRGHLKWRLDAIDDRMAAYGGYTWIYHDLGVEISEPFYFYQFMERAGRHGLQFLSEPGLEPANANYTPETTAALDALGDDVVAREQYADFLENREFRRSLLCRADVPLDRSLAPARIYSLRASSPIQPQKLLGSPDDAHAKEEFAAPGRMTVTVDQPAVKAAFRRLGQIWPGSASFDELLAAGAPEDAGPARTEDAGHLAASLLAMFRRDLITLTTSAPRQAAVVSERPVASARLRQQIACDRPILTNLRHAEMEVLDTAVRKLLTLLDGTRDRAALRRELGDWLDAVRPHAPTLPTRAWVDENLDTVLTGFARQHFLVA